MNGPVFPSNPAIGDRYMNWAWNGARWVCNPMAGVQIIQTVFTATGPYQPSPGLVSVQVECIGGGGGGGPASSDLANTTTSGWMMGGGGGSSGGYSKSTLASSLVLGGVNVTIGAGGAPGQPGTAGGVGGATTFGALVTANGGLGGGSGNPGDEFGDGGPRTQPGTGQIASSGSAGGTGIGYYFDTVAVSGFAVGGQGGNSFLGGANRNVLAPAGGGTGGEDGYQGSGGGGAASGLVTLPVPGGAGGAGLCIVTEYCWMDTADEDCGCPPTTGQARVARYSGGRGQWGDGFDD
jgi:hypothetical protein